RFRLSIQPAGCDAHTCGAKVNSKRVDSPTSLMHSYSPFCKKNPIAKLKIFKVGRGPTLLSQLGYCAASLLAHLAELVFHAVPDAIQTRDQLRHRDGSGGRFSNVAFRRHA